MEYKFSEDLVNEILGYLGTKPYTEVSNLINRIAKVVEEQRKPILLPHRRGKEEKSGD